MMHKYFLTFGQNSPFKDGYVIVWAISYEQAREKVIAEFGTKWSHLYERDNFDGAYYPNEICGELR